MVERDRIRPSVRTGAIMNACGRLSRFALRSSPLLLVAIPAFAQPADSSSPAREEIVVTATRSAQSSFDQPIAIDSIGQQTLQQGQLQVNLSESLARVPGILVQNRQNYAQDLQIESRGFGARSTFGVRSIRLYVDGIPATQPDGQGQVSNFDLGSAQRIEVMRGPFSALYGNASGGVIAIFTEDGQPGTHLEATAETGSFGFRRFAAKISGEQDGFNYVADAADFHTAGSRDHSRADRPDFNAKIRDDLDDQSSLTFLANAVSISAQDPLGLTRAQFAVSATLAGTGAIQFDTRKYVDQEQFGLDYKRALTDADSLDAIVYGGNRSVKQYQAIPLSTQASPQSPGGVIGLGNNYEGTDIHLTDKRQLGGAKLEVTTGVAYDQLDEFRTGYLNFIGGQTGVEGALRRDENDDVFSFDQYLQAQLDFDPLLVEAGVRNSRVLVSAHDHYVASAHSSNSGDVAYRATTPAAGVTWRMTDWVNLYASYGKGFETPSLNELAYRSTNGSLPGLNFVLKPSRSDNYEVGIKSFLGDNVKATLAGFHIDTTNELAIEQNTGGRSVYQNVGRTGRDGIELSLDGKLPYGFEVAAAYTWLRAIYVQSFFSCPSLPCVPRRVPAGNRIPGIPRNDAFAELSWHDDPSGFSAALETRFESRVYVDDPNSDSAPQYFTASIRTGFDQDFGDLKLHEFVRLDNLADRKYAGSVIVNESNGRFFEPAPGRAVYFGINAKYGW
ncbi:MAG TPA: TonB-dependent receptor [Alphaproteobacteria bacterium]|nr:TonB-dependent receptor [Alphaproteobacteria bacterium]